MKANVDFPKRVKNSFIYFQVGLIATMLVVLFILEFNFKDTSKSIGYVPPIEISSEPTFVYNPAPVTKPQSATKPVVVKVPKVAHVFKATKDEPKKDEDKAPLATQDNPADNQPKTDATPIDNPKDNGNGGVKEVPNVFSVEQLPMFEACKGVSRSEQKACFDEQLAKAVVKHLAYPESDLDPSQLEILGGSPLKDRVSFYDLIKRPEFTIHQILEQFNESCIFENNKNSLEAFEQVEIQIKYEA